jgi:hypothetical protein
MRLEMTRRDVLALIPQPCVVGSNPAGGAQRLCLGSRVEAHVQQGAIA